mmetsp:Transcript_37472/g.81951  ORF Transcript_37472/g.81951 Transcript_37472/m.81951 type:complete len:204 (+) Transcript_37472:546-1157(+)
MIAHSNNQNSLRPELARQIHRVIQREMTHVGCFLEQSINYQQGDLACSLDCFHCCFWNLGNITEIDHLLLRTKQKSLAQVIRPVPKWHSLHLQATGAKSLKILHPHKIHRCNKPVHLYTVTGRKDSRPKHVALGWKRVAQQVGEHSLDAVHMPHPHKNRHRLREVLLKSLHSPQVVQAQDCVRMVVRKNHSIHSSDTEFWVPA